MNESKLPRLHVLFAVGFLALAGRSLGQQPVLSPSPVPSRLVSVEMIVTDKDHHSVDNVSSNDVLVFEEGKPKALESFSRQIKPVRYTIAIDNSNSFRRFLTASVLTASGLISRNLAGDETEIVRFVSSDKISVQLAFTSDKTKLLNTVSKGTFLEDGQSAVIDALYVTVDKLRQAQLGAFKGRYALVLITDGEDRASFYTESNLFKLIRQSGVQIFVIGMVSDLDKEAGFIKLSPRQKAEKLLTQVAVESGGRCFLPKTVGELQQAINEIGHDLRSQFTMAYRISDSPIKSGFHKVEVKITDKRKLNAVVRPGYFVDDPNDKNAKKKSP
jgi:Ca-activated chloride channel family protein